ncbi:DTW domain-containing protein [Pseudomaricurvus hydrocarbonicus]|uniref:DTW domain-containing protein n=1 Tax=Pseudomaricurvus hydrocarbonicus TaxID=1470433 RepID=UPI001AA0B058
MSADTGSAFAPHAVDRLRQFCESQSTRVFNARGIALQRCPSCMLGHNTCICAWRKPTASTIDFVLLMHRDEVYKPTNTGRLIADLYPDQCQAFLWDRTRPDAELLALLDDPGRHCQVVFPPRDRETRIIETQVGAPDNQRRPTVILLDGTWKQARKMYSQATWLRALPVLDLTDAMTELDQQLGHYKVRQACETGRLATAEAAALCLQAAQDQANVHHLLNYFTVFNEHYVATRMNRKPARLKAHCDLENSQ